MKKYYFNILMCCMSFLSLDASAQVELIPNWNFENLSSSGQPAPPCNYGNEVFRAEPWVGDFLSSNSSIDGPQLCDTRNSVINGIEWCPGQGPFGPTAPGNQNGSQSPHSGNRYLCISSGAFYTERQFVYVPLNEPVYYGDTVDLSLYVSRADLRESLGFEVRLSGDTDWEPSSDPLIYTGTATNASNWIEHAATIAVSSPASEPNYCGPWNYLMIAANPNLNHSAMYLDDVSLKKRYDCFTQNDCISRAGPPSLLFSMPHNANFPFCAIGGDNLSYIKMEIFSLGGQNLIWAFEMDYPPHRICWDGKTLGGVDMANATYEYRIEAKTFCDCDKIYQDNFVKIGQSPANDPDYYYNIPGPGCPMPSSCCGDSDFSFNVNGCQISEDATYKVQNTIQVDNSQIMNGVGVIMEAGNRIVLTNFSTATNSTFVAEIVPCPRNKLTGENNQDYGVSANQDNTENKSEYPYRITPNPSIGSFAILGNEVPKSIQLLSATGQLVRSIPNPSSNYVFTDLPSGIYFVKIEKMDFSIQTFKAIVE